MIPKSSFLVLLVCVTSVQAWGIKAPKHKPTRPEYCNKPPFLGSCRPIVKPWYYNATVKRCQQISVGLCAAGNNWFVSDEKCKTVCERLTKNVPVECFKPPVTVACGQVRHAWYFDPNSAGCKMFSYTDPACDSVGNRFLTELKCQFACLPTSKPKPICSMDPEPDMCFLSKKQWFFNFKDNTCMKFQKGCGKGSNSFSTYDKCMGMCSYNQVTAASPTGKQNLQGNQLPLGKPGVPSQAGPLSPPAQSVQPSTPLQPGQRSKPGLGLNNQPGHPGLPLQSAGSGQPGQPSLIGSSAQGSSTLLPSTPAQSGQSSSRPGAGLPGQQGISPQRSGPDQPNQIGSTGNPGQGNPIFAPSTVTQFGQSSGAGVGLPGHHGQPGPPSTPTLSGKPSGHGVRLPGPAGPPLLPGPAGKPVLSVGPGSLVQPGFGGSTVAPSTPAVSGPSIGHGVGVPGHTGSHLISVSAGRPAPSSRHSLPVRSGYGTSNVSPSTPSLASKLPGLPSLPGASGTATQVPPNTLPNSPMAPKYSVSPGLSPSSGVAVQNKQSFLPGPAGQTRPEKQFRPYRSTNR